jgi:hypothetical protein
MPASIEPSRIQASLRASLVPILLLALLGGLLASLLSLRGSPSDLTGGEGLDPLKMAVSTGDLPPKAGRSASSGPAASAADALARLSEGRILFNPPARMVRGHSERVEVRITSSPDLDLEAGLLGTGPAREEPIRVGLTMTVELLGSAFEILSLNEKEQLVPPGDFAQWAFDVTPTRSGLNRLTVRSSVRVQVDGVTAVRDIPVLDRQIEVRSDPELALRTFLEKNWQFIASAVLLPLLGFGLKTAWDLLTRKRKRRKARKKNAPAANPEPGPSDLQTKS